jgi:hypothetical protein
MLNIILGLRHPDKKFEVVNAAMTGINSHVILPLARGCEEAHGDIWVIYMGNNEVVGPFGAGTVFGNQTTPLPWIRAGLALKATRLGQLLDALRGAAQKTNRGEKSIHAANRVRCGSCFPVSRAGLAGEKSRDDWWVALVGWSGSCQDKAPP